MPVPWTGLHNLLDPESVITWEDLADIVMIVRKIARTDDGLLWECLLGHHHVNHAAYAAMDTVPSAKAVGRVLARALNGMLIEDGWGQELGSPRVALRQEIRCGTCVQTRKLPAEAHAGRLIHFEGYPFIVLGTHFHHIKENSRTDRELSRLLHSYHPAVSREVRLVRIGCHRMMCWPAHGDPPADKPECVHGCGDKRCVRPACLRWGTKAEKDALQRAGRKRRK
jgi:hypothetical protein